MNNFRRRLFTIDEVKNSGAVLLPECDSYMETSIMCKKIYLPVDLCLGDSVTYLSPAFSAKPFYVNNNNVVMGDNINAISARGVDRNGESADLSIADSLYGVRLDFRLGTFTRNDTRYAIDPGDTRYVAGASMTGPSSNSSSAIGGCVTLLGNCIGSMGLTSSNSVTQMGFVSASVKVFPEERYYVCFDASDFSLYDGDNELGDAEGIFQVAGFCIFELNGYSEWIDTSHNCPIEIYYEPFD